MFPLAQKWASLYSASIPRPELQSYITTYEYSMLHSNSRSFRVFRLFPLQTQDLAQKHGLEGPLRGRIEIISLNDPGHYNALSYCWEGSIEPSPYHGQNKDRVIIESPDGSSSQIVISPALATALRVVRARGEPLPLFVDQICIDQRDNIDKSQQVSLMGEIYRNCDCVLAWLDGATKHTDALFDFIPKISSHILLLQLVQDHNRFAAIFKSFMARRMVSDEGALQQDVKDVVELCREHWDNFPHHGFLEICLRRWFRRVWIVQEACLGPKMTFLCGKASCSAEALEVLTVFQRLVDTYDTWESAGPSVKSRGRQAKGDESSEAKKSGQLVFRIFQERAGALSRPGDTRVQGMRRGLQNLVVRFNVDTMEQGPFFRLGSSNPRDYIYALQGLASGDEVISKKLVIDYDPRVSTAAIFTEFTRMCLDTSDGIPHAANDMSPHSLIDTLFFAQMDTKVVDGLPAWVPDWSANLTIPHGYRTGGFPVFDAGGGNGSLRSYCIRPEIDVSKPGILKIRAVLLCKVDRVGTHFMQFSSRRRAGQFGSRTVVARTIFAFFREVRDMCKWASDQPHSASIPSTAELDKAVWITTTGGHGLTLTTERTLMGREAVNGQPLLGYLWDFQLEMEVLPTIIRRRRDQLTRVAALWTLNSRSSIGSRWLLFWKAYAFLLYCGGRLMAEAYHLYLLWRFMCGLPYLLFFGRDSEDMMYAGIFGSQWRVGLGMLKYVLARHVRRKCFASGGGHVGLGPVGMQLGDVVVVPLGATLPVILRPGAVATEPCRYVGEAYCHGFMDREALEEGNGLEKRDFEIM